MYHIILPKVLFIKFILYYFSI